MRCEYRKETHVMYVRNFTGLANRVQCELIRRMESN